MSKGAFDRCAYVLPAEPKAHPWGKSRKSRRCSKRVPVGEKYCAEHKR